MLLLLLLPLRLLLQWFLFPFSLYDRNVISICFSFSFSSSIYEYFNKIRVFLLLLWIQKWISLLISERINYKFIDFLFDSIFLSYLNLVSRVTFCSNWILTFYFFTTTNHIRKYNSIGLLVNRTVRIQLLSAFLITLSVFFFITFLKHSFSPLNT